jgi:hypothetical protein
MDYYEIKADFYNFPNQYFITEISNFNNPKAQLNWDDFLKNYSTDRHEKYIATIESGNEEVDFSTTLYGFCIVSEKFAQLLERIQIDDFLIVPLSFEKQLTQRFYLLVDFLTYDCVDEVNSEFQKFIENDPVRPDLAGQYRAFFKLTIDASKVDNADLFRLEKEKTTIIVSQRIKNIYEENNLKGACFTKVTL